MATGDKKVYIFNKRIMSLEDFRDRFLGFLDGVAKSALGRVFRTDGAFDTAITVTASVSANKVDVAAASAFSATDGLGNVLEGTAATSSLQGVKIPPDAGAAIVYYLGLKYESVPRGIVTNPKTQVYEYDYLEDTIGVLGVPNTVAVEGDGLRITVNSLTESDYDHSGRTVRVWLKSVTDSGIGPQSPDAAVAFEEVAVEYDAGDNTILTTGTLGQLTPSTDSSLYQVLLIGPKVVRSTVEDLRTAEGIFFVAAITAAATGDPITVISHTDQVVHGDFGGHLEDVIETAGGHTKIAVKAYEGDSEQRQISVVPSAGGDPVFSVDEDGDVVIGGDLTIGGSEIVSTTEIVLGSAELGDDPATDEFDVWAQMTLRAGDKGGGPPYAKWSNVYLGDGDEATPGNKLVFDGTTVDLEVKAETQGSVWDLVFGRNDAAAGASNVIYRNDGAGGGLGIKSQGGITIGLGDLSTSPSLIFDVSTANADWAIYNSAGSLFHASNASADKDYYITNLGSGLAHLLVKGPISINAANGYLDNTAASLKFLDTNLGGAVPLTHGSEAGGTGLQTVATSILSAIEEVRTLSGPKAAHRSGVLGLNGLSTSASGGLNVTTTAGSAWVNGRKWTYGSSTVQAMTNSATNYVYITNGGSLTKTVDPATAFADDVLCLAVVVASGGAVTSVENIKLGIPYLGQKMSITVGQSSTNYNTDFATLPEALNWIKQIANQLPTLKRPEVEIVIVGQVDMTGSTYTLMAQHSGLHIRGIRTADVSGLATGGEYTVSGYGTARILWGAGAGSYRLFEVSGNVNDILFEDLTFVFSSAAVQANSALYYVGPTSGAACHNLRFERCRFTFSGTHPFASIVRVPNTCTVNTATIAASRIERNGADTGMTGVIKVDSTGVLNNLTVAGTTIYEPTAQTTEETFSLLGQNAAFTNTRMVNYGHAIIANVTGTLRIADCVFEPTTTGGARCLWSTGACVAIVHHNRCIVTGTGALERTAIRVDNARAVITDNDIYVDFATAGIQTLGTVAHPGSKIANNSIYAGGSLINLYGIQNAHGYTSISGNTLSIADNGVSSRGILNTGDHCSITGNIVAHSLAQPMVDDGIVSSGTYCIVGYNTVRATTPYTITGTGSIFNSGDNVSRAS